MTMFMDWKSYGDTGQILRGKRGNWIVITDGMWWHVNLRYRTGHLPDQRMGRFETRQSAQTYAESADLLVVESGVSSGTEHKENQQ